MDRLSGWLLGAVLILLLVVFDQHHALNQIKVQLEEETKIELYAYKTSREEMQRAADCWIATQDKDEQEKRIEGILQQCETGFMDTKARLLETSDLLESVTRCSAYKLQPEHCVGRFDLKTFIEENRTGNF